MANGLIAPHLTCELEVAQTLYTFAKPRRAFRDAVAMILGRAATFLPEKLKQCPNA